MYHLIENGDWTRTIYAPFDVQFTHHGIEVYKAILMFS